MNGYDRRLFPHPPDFRTLLSRHGYAGAREAFDAWIIHRALKHTGGRVRAAARLVKMPVSTFSALKARSEDPSFPLPRRGREDASSPGGGHP